MNFLFGKLDTDFKLTFLSNRFNHIIFLYSLLSILFAVFLIYKSHGWVNNDFVLYHECARLILNGDLKSSINLYNWPLYPSSIALISFLSNVNLQTAAQIFTVIMFALTMIAFLLIVKESGGSNSTILIAGLILLSNTYLVAKVLAMLIKDSGFWAFHLFSILFLLKNLRQPSLLHGVFWQFFAILATLFRVEGIFYLILLPLLSFFLKKSKSSKNIYAIFSANSLNFIFLLFLFLYAIITKENSNDFGRLADLVGVIFQSFNSSVTLLKSKFEIFSTAFKGDFSNYYLLGFTLVYILFILLKMIQAAGWLSFMIFVSQFRMPYPKLVLSENFFLVFKSVSIITLAIGVLTVLVGFQLPSRYLSPFAFLLMILSAFYLNRLYEQSSKKLHISYLFCFFISIIFILLLRNFIKPNEINYQINAANWIKSSGQNLKNVFFNVKRVNYYAGGAFIKENNLKGCESLIKLKDENRINKFNLLVIDFKRDEDLSCFNSDVYHRFNLKVIKRIESKSKRNFIIIFRPNR